LKANVLKTENDTNTAGKQLYALSSILSENILSTHVFIQKCNGIEILGRYISEKTTEETIPLKVS
jgi:hypothetical protein